MGQPNYVNGFELSVHEHVLEKPLEWKTPQVIFVNSMSDLFHKDVPLEFIQRVFDVMKRAHWHQFQVLTKRSERLAELSPYLEWVVGVRDQCRRRESRSFSSSGDESRKHALSSVEGKKAGRLLDGRTRDEMPREMGFAKVKKIGGVIAAFLLAGKRDTWLFSVQHILPIEEKNVASLPREFQ